MMDNKPQKVISFDEKFFSIEQFCNHLLTLRGDYIFRGCFNEKYKLVPGTYRLINNDKNNYGYLDAEYQHEALLKFLTNYVPEKRFEAYCNAQHYGMATKLLDFSKNPLIALLFACEEWNEEHEDINGKLFIIDKNKYQQIIGFNFEILEELLFECDESTTGIEIIYDKQISKVELNKITLIDPIFNTNLKRINRQEGCFLLFPKLCQFIYEIEDEDCSEIYIIPKEYKKEFINYIKEKYDITMDKLKDI